MEYIDNPQKPLGCVFCREASREDSAQNLIVARGERAFVILNRYPYTSGHLMVVPFDHVPTLEALVPETRAEMMELATHAVGVLRAVYRPEAFNLGVNIGAAAGAGIADHVHLHVVPRWPGDTNFMSTVGAARVIPEDLPATWERVRRAWDSR
ncbi:MAG TPA: HIT domain-containing protein [Anaerolineaceae bacterium]|jgi:ATP adenylyltransferase